MSDLDKLFLRTFLWFVGIALAVSLAIIAVVVVGFFVLTLGAGLFGLLCVKTKRPIVPPHGFILFPFVYAIIWAAAITVALYLGGLILNDMRDVRVGNPFQSWRKDALLFFAEAAWVLFVAARFSRSKLAQVSPLKVSAAVSAVAAMTFSISTAFLEVDTIPDAMIAIARDVVQTVIFPFVRPFELLQEGELARVWRWLLSIDANLFKLSGVISKFVWIYALFQFVRGLTKAPQDEPTSMRRGSLTGAELGWFAATVVAAGAVAAIVGLQIRDELQGTRSSFWIMEPFFMFFVAYAVLWVVLWRSRYRAEFD